MIQRLFLSVVLAWTLFSSGIMSCGSNGPGEGEITNTEDSGSNTTTPTGGTDGDIEPGTTAGSGTGGEETTGGGGTGSTTGTSGTTTSATTGTGTGGGTTSTGGAGSGGTLTMNICTLHPEICYGQVVPANIGPSPIGGYTPGGLGGVGDMPAPDAAAKLNPGVEAIKQFGQFGTVTTPIVNEELTQGGVFTATNGFTMKDGVTKDFPKGTVITVTKEGLATATTPDGTVENLPSDATVYFTGGAAVTRTGASAFTLQPGHAVRFGVGNFQIFQGTQGQNLGH